MTNLYQSFRIALIVLLASLSGCNDEGPELVGGQMRSGQPDLLEVDNLVNAIMSSSCDGQTFLWQVAIVSPGQNRFDPSHWSLVFRADRDTHKNFMASDSENEIRLLSSFVAEVDTDENCSIKTQETASWLAETGYLTMETWKKGQFSLNFQREIVPWSGQTSGPVVNVEGCWLVSSGNPQCDVTGLTHPESESQQEQAPEQQEDAGIE